MGWRSVALLSVSVMVAGLGAGVATAGAQGRSGPTVTDAVQVTDDPAAVRAHTSPQMARNPKTGELVIVEGDIRGSRKCTVHISADDGRSWAEGGEALEPPYTDCSFHADWGPYATLAFDNDGVLYMAIEASDPKYFDQARNDAPRNIFLARSEDSGRTWDTTLAYKAQEGDPDKGINKGATVAVDPKHPRYVYLGWRQGSFGAPTTKEKLKTEVAASSDGGRTWSDPAEVTDSRGGDFPWLTVTPDGVLHVVTWTRVWPVPPAGQPNPVRELFHVSSADHGRTFSERHTIDPGNQAHEHPPVLASDPRTGALYVAWSAQPDALNGATTYQADLEAYFRASTDGGRTWGDKVLLNDDPKGRANQIDPGISVAPNGRIDIAWYDGRLSPTPLAQRTETGFNDVFSTFSTDGGRTFAPNVRVSDRSADRSIGVWANNVDQRLNVGITSSNQAAYVAWSDTRNANRDFQPEDVYMASLQFQAPAVPAEGSGSLPGWLAVSAGIAIGLGLATAGAVLAGRRSSSSSPGPARVPQRVA
jgi:hypothetical protein